jgi:uncharacterized protein
MNIPKKDFQIWVPIAILIVSSFLMGKAVAQSIVPGDSVSIPGLDLSDLGSVSNVTAVFGKPLDRKLPFPVVLILHGSGGIDGRGAFYAKSLHEAGIATLEINMFPRGNRPKEGTRATLPHAAAALKWLAAQPSVDSKRIGVMGFSWGGVMSVTLASKLVQERLGSDVPAPVAFAPFYPSCTGLVRSIPNKRSPLYGWHERMGDRPMLIQIGKDDDYEEGDRPCDSLVAEWPEAKRSSTSIIYYDGATHGFDTQESGRSFFDQFARGGKGGQVRFYPSQNNADAARSTVTAFFSKSFSP